MWTFTDVRDRFCVDCLDGAANAAGAALDNLLPGAAQGLSMAPFDMLQRDRAESALVQHLDVVKPILHRLRGRRCRDPSAIGHTGRAGRQRGPGRPPFTADTG